MWESGGLLVHHACPNGTRHITSALATMPILYSTLPSLQNAVCTEGAFCSSHFFSQSYTRKPLALVRKISSWWLTGPPLWNVEGSTHGDPSPCSAPLEAERMGCTSHDSCSSSVYWMPSCHGDQTSECRRDRVLKVETRRWSRGREKSNDGAWHSSRTCLPSCLCAFVSSCLRVFVPSCLISLASNVRNSSDVDVAADSKLGQAPQARFALWNANNHW